MKKLLTPILVLTLIVGFSALALGVQASDSQSLTVDVQNAYSITVGDTGPTTVTVGPDTTASNTGLKLEYKVNDEDANKIQVACTNTFLDGLALTFDITNMDANGGTDSTPVELTSNTNSGTLISGGFTAGKYTTAASGNDPATLNIGYSKVNWSEPAGNSKTLDIVYRFIQ